MQVHAPGGLSWVQNACLDTTKIDVDSFKRCFASRIAHNIMHNVHNVRTYSTHINACIVNTALGCSCWCISIQHELDTHMQYYISSDMYKGIDIYMTVHQFPSSLPLHTAGVEASGARQE